MGAKRQNLLKHQVTSGTYGGSSAACRLPCRHPAGMLSVPFPDRRACSEEALIGPLAQRILRALASGRGAPAVCPPCYSLRAGHGPRGGAAQGLGAAARGAPDLRRRGADRGAHRERRGDRPPGSTDPSAPPGAQLALVVSQAALAAAASAAPRNAPILPDFLALRRPEAPSGSAVWAVWREGARTVVRRSDGTGFAVATDALPALWARAGRPALLSLGAALPSGLPATDLSAAPPDPDPLDLAFSFRAAGSERACDPAPRRGGHHRRCRPRLTSRPRGGRRRGAGTHRRGRAGGRRGRAGAGPARGGARPRSRPDPRPPGPCRPCGAAERFPSAARRGLGGHRRERPRRHLPPPGLGRRGRHAGAARPGHCARRPADGRAGPARRRASR